MKDFLSLARTRRSMRKFTEEVPTDNELNTIMRAALMAPSSKGLHSWQFVVVKDKDTINSLAQCKSQGSDFIKEAPVVIVVAADPNVSDVWIEDASVATTMMLLQAEDLGLGACWVQVRERYTADARSAEDIVREMLGLPSHIRILSLVAIGYKGMERKPFNEERLLWNKVTGL